MEDNMRLVWGKHIIRQYVNKYYFSVIEGTLFLDENHYIPLKAQGRDTDQAIACLKASSELLERASTLYVPKEVLDSGYFNGHSIGNNQAVKIAFQHCIPNGIYGKCHAPLPLLYGIAAHLSEEFSRQNAIQECLEKFCQKQSLVQGHNLRLIAKNLYPNYVKRIIFSYRWVEKVRFFGKKIGSEWFIAALFVGNGYPWQLLTSSCSTSLPQSVTHALLELVEKYEYVRAHELAISHDSEEWLHYVWNQYATPIEDVLNLRAVSILSLCVGNEIEEDNILNPKSFVIVDRSNSLSAPYGLHIMQVIFIDNDFQTINRVDYFPYG